MNIHAFVLLVFICTRYGCDSSRLDKTLSKFYQKIHADIESARDENSQSNIRLNDKVTEEIKYLRDGMVIISKRLTELSDKVENIVELDKKIQQANGKLDISILSMETMSDKLDTLYTAIRMSMINANGNVALNKPATQSTTHTTDANAATDGNKDGEWLSYSCTHTKPEANPWWSVDLQDQILINKVVIANRLDCCGERLHDLTLTVSKTDDGEEVLCGQYIGPSTNGAIETIRCAPDVVGRFLKIQIKGTSEVLTLCEVEVYGTRDMNL